MEKEIDQTEIKGGCHYCLVGDTPEWLGNGWFHCNAACVQSKCTTTTVIELGTVLKEQI